MIKVIKTAQASAFLHKFLQEFIPVVPSLTTFHRDSAMVLIIIKLTYDFWQTVAKMSGKCGFLFLHNFISKTFLHTNVVCNHKHRWENFLSLNQIVVHWALCLLESIDFTIT